MLLLHTFVYHGLSLGDMDTIYLFFSTAKHDGPYVACSLYTRGVWFRFDSCATVGMLAFKTVILACNVCGTLIYLDHWMWLLVIVIFPDSVTVSRTARSKFFHSYIC